jgi:tRNA(Arg) A34 adenosine deaminase TadA
MIDQAIEIARRDFPNHTADAFRHWSFIYQNKRLLEWGRNKLNNPVGFHKYGYKDARHSLHSEAIAMRKAYGLLDRRKPWTCINVRLGAAKELRIAAPCSICSSFLAACGCNKVYFTVEGNVASMRL